MSLRRGGAAVSLQTDSDTAQIGAKPMSSPKARRNHFISGILVVFLVGGYFMTFSSDASTKNKKKTYSSLRAYPAVSTVLPNFEPIHEQCTVWVAESSLKGFAGYGVFTTRDLNRGESIVGQPDGVAIPVETDWDSDAPKKKKRYDWWNMWGNYVWGRGVPDHARYYAGEDVVEYQIAFGALPNHHCILASLDYVYPTPPYDDTLADRFSDPGAGAFTYNRGRQFTVDRALSAGSEIFLNYGYCKHKGGKHHNPDWVDNIYVTGDYSEAATLIWDTIRGRGSSLKFDSEGNLEPPTDVARLVRELLPQTRKELAEMERKVKSKTDLAWYLAVHKSLKPHSPEWIRKNGMCLENLLPYKSTLPHAGQGAFAQYHIKKDDIVMPAPLLQIVDKEVLDIYKNGNHIGKQLLLNYCFGHPQSSLLLCPDTQAELINHCSKRTKQCGPHGPNAAIRWSRGWDPTSEEWRKKSLRELAKEPGRGLAFEVFALRDIRPGEEVFIDYGREWEDAWGRHLETYTPPKKPATKWITAKEANDNKDEILHDFVSGNLRETVDHKYLFTACQYYASEDDEHKVYEEENAEWVDLSDEDILSWYASSSKGYEYWDSGGYSTHGDYTHWPCSVLLEEQMGTYTVRIHQSPYEDTMPWDEHDVPRILTSYSRANIHYFVKPFAADQFLTNAFRHPLGVPDEIFPAHWKDLA